jgi:hypothetical protein
MVSFLLMRAGHSTACTHDTANRCADQCRLILGHCSRATGEEKAGYSKR